MTTDTPPPPPEGWAIVPAYDPRLDCLPVRPLFLTSQGTWVSSANEVGESVSRESRNDYTYALPIQAEAVPGQPKACACGSTTWQVIDDKQYQCPECGRRAWIIQKPVPSQPPASADSKDEEIARLKECLFQMQEAAKGLALASADPKGQAGAAKPPLGLIPPEAMRQAAIVHALGARKYKAWNWRETKVLASTYVNAALRHIAEYQDRQDVEPESGQSPLAHAIASLNILLDAKKAGTLIDDRPPARLALDSQCPD